MFLSEAIGQQNNPAANVEDRSSSIRITRLTATRAESKVFVKIDTNHGISGWGEITASEPNIAAGLANSLFELLDGENPTRIEYLWQKLYRAHRDIRGGPFMVHTIAAIDSCLWDITGRLWNVPVYRLLGGPCRDRIRIYPTDKAQKVPPHGIYEHSGNPADIERMVAAIKAARDKVGPDGTVMFDAHCAVPPATLIQLAAAIKSYDLLFLEEVAVPGNIDVFKRLKEHIDIPMATGERDRTIWGMIDYLTNRCIDILQPDCAHTGGISQVRKIATLAEVFNVPLAPHCTATFLGVSASMHAIAAVPYFLIHEVYPGITPKDLVRMPWEVDKEGYVGLPPGPGLGVEIDEAVLEKLSKTPYSWKWPVYGRLKDGSISDY
jgi:galactonate dehydratase